MEPRLRGIGRFVLALVLAAAVPSRLPAHTTQPSPRLDPSALKEGSGQTDPPKDDKDGGDPVTLSNGAFELEKSDLWIRSRGMDFEFKRIYRSGSSMSSPLGVSWDFNWNQKLTLEIGPPLIEIDPDPMGGSQTQSKKPGKGKTPDLIVKGAYYSNGALRIDRFDPDGPTWGQVDSWISPLGYFAKLQHEGVLNVNEKGGLPDYFLLRSADGRIMTFEEPDIHDPYQAGITYHLTKIEDRSGNKIRLVYEDAGAPKAQHRRLDYVIDTLGRVIDFEYDSNETLASISDFAGRTVVFDHDGYGNLTEVRSPAVTDTVTDNDFPDGKGVSYEYVTVAGDEHYLKKIIDAEEWQNGNGSETPYLINCYDSLGRVEKQTYGGTNASGIAAGGVFRFIYEPQDPPSDWKWFTEHTRTLIIDPNGNVSLHLFDDKGFDRLNYRFTGRLDPEGSLAPIDTLVNFDPENPSTGDALASPEFAALRAGDPGSYFTRSNFNAEGLLEEQWEPGRHVKYTYDITSEDRFQRGNLLMTEVFPSGKGDPIVTINAYEPVYNQLRASFDPRGLDENHTPPNGGTNSPERYMTENVFDYQEGGTGSGAIDALVDAWEIDLDQTTQDELLDLYEIDLEAISTNLPDVNGDSIENQTRGNVILTRSPTTQVFVDPASSSPSFESQTIETKTRYNAFSLVTHKIDPEGNVTAFEFYSEEDPDGDGTPTEEPPLGITLDTDTGANGGGFLAQTLEPESVSIQLEYNELGWLVTRTDGRGFETTTEYNQLGQVVQETDPLGYQRRTVYDWNDNVVEIHRTNKVPTYDSTTLVPNGETTGASGEFIVDRFEYDLLDHLIEEDVQADAKTRLVTKHRYDKNGNRVLTLLPEFDNDASNIVSMVFDERDLAWQTTRGGVTSEWEAVLGHEDIDESVTTSKDVSTTHQDYDLAGMPTVFTDGEGKAFERMYDLFERLEQTVDPLGNYATFEYDALGQIVDEKAYDDGDLLLSHTKRSFDEVGRVFQVDRKLVPIDASEVSTTPDGPLTPGDDFVTTRYLFDMNGRTTIAVDDNQVVTVHGYDGRNRLTGTTDAASNQVEKEYDKNDNLIHITETEVGAGGSEVFETWNFYDENNRLVATANDVGFVSHVTYDSRGNAVFRSDANAAVGQATIASLDLHGDHQSLPSTLINGHGNSTVFKYDDAGRLVQTDIHMRSTGLGGGTVQSHIDLVRTYDLNSRLTTETDDAANTTTYEYDSLNRLKTTTFDDTTFESRHYDRRDLLDILEKPNGYTEANDHDDAGRLIERTVTRPGGTVYGTDSEAFTYDGLGRVKTAVNDDSTVARSYDSLGNVIQESIGQEVTVSVYDGVGVLRHIEYPGGRVIEQVPDAINRLSQVKSGTGTVFAEWDWIGPARIEERRMPQVNSAVVSMLWDGARRPTSVLHTNTGGVIEERLSEWDRANNRMSREDTERSILHQYSYDSAYRMTQSDRTGADPVAYNLDGVGNRLDVDGGIGDGEYVMTGTDADVNQYTETPFDDREYDLNGNLEAIDGAHDVEILYDYANRMVSWHDVTADLTHTYLYDAFGRRVSKTVAGSPSVETNYLYLGWRIIEEQSDTGTTLATYVYGAGLDELVLMRRNSRDYYYHQDDLGNVYAISTAQGGVVERYEYLDYGVIVDPSTFSPLGTASANGNPVFFAGARFDQETGLYWMRNRYMDPRSGRFVTRDPLGVWGDKANLGNGSAYAGNNPWTWTDPTGREAATATAGAFLAGEAAASAGAGGLVTTAATIAGPVLLVGLAGLIIYDAATIQPGPTPTYENWKCVRGPTVEPAALPHRGLSDTGEFGPLSVPMPLAEIPDFVSPATSQQPTPGTRPGDLPARVEPHSTEVVDKGVNKEGKPDGTIREYGPDGKAKTDYDFGHDHGKGDPHAHDWDWSKCPPRQAGRSLKPGE